MAKPTSSIRQRVAEFVGRLIKAVMAAIVLPAAAGLLLAVLGQLERIPLGALTARDWMERGFFTYVGLHLLLYRPVPLFRASHRLFSMLAVWLFGGQVAAVGEGGSKSRGGKGGNGAEAQSAQGSTLVAFSPYVIPLYAVLLCTGGWLLTRWWDHVYVDGPTVFLLGAAMGLHWIMTADDLQQQRKRWHIETYLLAIGLVFVLTLLIGSACLPWALPDFSFVQALSDGLSNTHTTLQAVIRHLFF